MTNTLPPLALVTGAACGIGKAIAERLTDQGFEVVINDRDGEAAQATASAIGSARAAVLDLLDGAAAAHAASERPVAALVNNVRIFDERSIFELSSADFRRMYDVNVVALFALSQAIAAHAAWRQDRQYRLARLPRRA